MIARSGFGGAINGGPVQTNALSASGQFRSHPWQQCRAGQQPRQPGCRDVRERSAYGM